MKNFFHLSLAIVLFATTTNVWMSVHAASIPTLSLLPASGGSNQIQVNVNGADPDAAVILYYLSSTNQLSSVGLGLTNQNGSYFGTLNPSTYGIGSGSQVYVSVDGAHSSSVAWPQTSGTVGSLSLSQTFINMAGGQSSTITATGAVGSLLIKQNTSGGVALGSVVGNSIVITAYNNPGTTVLTVCDSANNCQNINISVITGAATALTLSSVASNLIVGQSQTITISGLGPFYISQNSNPATIAATLSGNNLVLNALSAGSAAITVCQSSNTCNTVNVYVNYSSSSVVSSGVITFSPNSVNLSIGQGQTVALSGGSNGQYYLSGNSNPTAVSAIVSGTNIVVTGLSTGTASLSVCAYGSQCGTFTATVSTSNTPVLSTMAPTLSSFTASSNNSGGSFLSAGNVLTLGFNFNQSVNTPTVTVAGSAVSVTGSGSGPYTASYTIPTTPSTPLAITVSFMNTAGSGNQAYFWLGNSSTAPAGTGFTASAVTTSNCPAGYTCAAAPGASSGTASTASTFTEYMYMGMNTQNDSDAQVVALQKRLIRDGYLSGGSDTGYFGPLTKSAVKKYQTAHGLQSLGVVGPATRNLLNQGI